MRDPFPCVISLDAICVYNYAICAWICVKQCLYSNMNVDELGWDAYGGYRGIGIVIVSIRLMPDRGIS